MANIVNITGFETGDFSECLFVSGTASIQTSVKRTGNYAARVNPSGTGDGGFNLGKHDSNGNHVSLGLTTTYVKFYFRYATKAATNQEYILQLYGTVDVKISLLLKSDGTILVTDSVGDTLGTITKVLSANTWYRIEVKCGVGSNADYAILIDGFAELSGSGNVGADNSDTAYFGKVTNLNSNSVDYYYDDIAISDNTYPGPSEVRLLKPNSNGTFTSWIGAYTDVDEIPHDSNTTVISTSTNENVESVNLQSTGDVDITSDGINALKSFAIARRTGLVVNAKVRLRSGSTNNDTDGADLDTVYNYFSKLYNTNPNGSVPWLKSDVDSVEVGIVHNQVAAREAYCTSLGVMVDSVTYVTGISSLISTESVSINTKNILIGLSSLIQSGELSIYSDNILVGVGSLIVETSLTIHTKNVLVNNVSLNYNCILSPSGLILLNEKFDLTSSGDLVIFSNNILNGFTNLQSVVSIDVIATAEIEAPLNVVVTMVVSGTADWSAQSSFNSQGSLSVQTGLINIGKASASTNCSLSCTGERVGNGAVSANVNGSITSQATNLLSGKLSFNTIASLLISIKNTIIGNVSKQATVSLNVTTKNNVNGLISSSTLASLSIKTSSIFVNRLNTNASVSLYAHGTYNVLGKTTIIGSSALSAKYLTEIGVLQYVERTIYINRLLTKTLKIGVKRG